MGPLQQSCPPWLKPLVTPLAATDRFLSPEFEITIVYTPLHYEII